MDKVKIGGIMQSEGRSLLSLAAVPPRALGTLLATLGEVGINLELVAAGHPEHQPCHLMLVVDRNHLAQATALLEGCPALPSPPEISVHRQVSVISVFAPHLREKPRVPGLMFSALARAGVSPLAVATSISSLSAVVEAHLCPAALKALLGVFEVPLSVHRRPQGY